MRVRITQMIWMIVVGLIHGLTKRQPTVILMVHVLWPGEVGGNAQSMGRRPAHGEECT